MTRSFYESVISDNWVQNVLNQFKLDFLISNFWLTNFTIVIPIEITPGYKLLSQICQSEIQKLLSLWMLLGVHTICNLKIWNMAQSLRL